MDFTVERLLLERAEAAARSVGMDLSRAEEPLSSVVARWRDGVGIDWSGKMALQVDTFLRAKILPEFGSRPVGAIRHSDMQARVGRLGREGAGRLYQVMLPGGVAAERVFKSEAAAHEWAARKPGRVLSAWQVKGLSPRTVQASSPCSVAS